MCKYFNCDIRRILNEYQSSQRKGDIEFVGMNVLKEECKSKTDGKVTALPLVQPFATCLGPPPSPIVSSVWPAVGPNKGGTVVTLKGEFEAGSDPSSAVERTVRVLVNGVEAKNVEIVNKTEIKATTPPAVHVAGVTDYGFFENTFEDCMESKYSPVVVEISCGSAFVLRSRETCTFEYEWPEFQSKYKLREKARRIKRGLKVQCDDEDSDDFAISKDATANKSYVARLASLSSLKLKQVKGWIFVQKVMEDAPDTVKQCVREGDAITYIEGQGSMVRRSVQRVGLDTFEKMFDMELQSSSEVPLIFSCRDGSTSGRGSGIEYIDVGRDGGDGDGKKQKQIEAGAGASKKRKIFVDETSDSDMDDVFDDDMEDEEEERGEKGGGGGDDEDKGKKGHGLGNSMETVPQCAVDKSIAPNGAPADLNVGKAVADSLDKQSALGRATMRFAGKASKASLPRPESPEALAKQLSIMKKMSQDCENNSLASLIEDKALNALPSLAGAVFGFGEELENSPDGLITGKNLAGKLKNTVKAPSNERLFERGLGDAGYYGCADVFVQRPLHANDRRLLGGGGLYRMDRYQGGEREDEVMEDVKEEGGGEVDLNEDGTQFISAEASSRLGWLLGEELRKELRIDGAQAQPAPNVWKGMCERARALVTLALDIMPRENAKMYTLYYGLGSTTSFMEDDIAERGFGDKYLDCSNFATNGEALPLTSFLTRVDSRMALDVFPCLRAMAVCEKVRDDVEKTLGGSVDGGAYGLRRSTRRTPKRRTHKFDTFGLNIMEKYVVGGKFGQYVGREVGNSLAKLFIGDVSEAAVWKKDLETDLELKFMAD